jgi:IMP dehydrogenase
MKTALTFDDVALVPQFNNILSRTDPSLETWLTRNRTINMPLIPANMDTVICPELASILIKNGGIPIFHRFTDFDTQMGWVKKYGNDMFISTGVNPDDYNNVKNLLDAGAGGVCIDIAHGHDYRVIELIRKLKNDFPEKDVIAGNVCTSLGFMDLVNAGADAVKVGIGPGSVCTTRVVTGFGVPQFTAIKDCANLATKLRVPIIADGGIRGSADVVKALAAGASTVMIGKLFAQTNESAASKSEGGVLKYRGQASEDFQKDFKGGMKVGTVAEGIAFKTSVSGSAQDMIDKVLGGVRSGMTYGGARTIKELQRKSEFVHVYSQSYNLESNPRTN